MSLNDTIARINELAKKAKTVGLTEEELVERDKLRRIYIDSVKANLVATWTTPMWSTRRATRSP